MVIFHSYVSVPEGIIGLWLGYNDRSLFSRTLEIMGIGFGKSSPFMALLFRLVKYDNLPGIMTKPVMVGYNLWLPYFLMVIIWLWLWKDLHLIMG